MKHNPRLVYDVPAITTFRELMDHARARYADQIAFLYRDGEEIREVTYERAYREMVAFATYLRSRVPAGSKVAVTGKNSYHWALTYLAVTCGVGIIVPIDKDLRADEIADLMADSEAVALVYSDEQSEKVADATGNYLALSMNDMERYLAEGQALLDGGDTSYATHHVDPHALGILLYTSGTTGVAKGVMLSQYNICFDITHILCRVHVGPEDRALSVAPLHHTYEMTAGCLCMLYSGASIAYNSSLRRLQAEMKLFRPTLMAVVPLILETFRNAVIKKYGQMKGGKTVLALQRAAADATSSRSARKKIFSVVNDTFGGRMRLLVCGAALLPPEVFRDFERFGIQVMIGYGLTETAPVCLMHNDFYNAPDDIGYPMSGVQVRLDDINEEGVGELVVKGPNVMLGYYKNPEETARVMEDGWFHTGDLARMTPRGTYQIAGRAKSMIVTPGGKKVFPEELELHLGKSPYVKECMVYEGGKAGDRRITAAIFPDEETVSAKLAKEGCEPGSDAYRAAERALLEDLVQSVNAKFPQYKRIRHTVVRHREFEKTTTRKIKRNAPDNLSEEE